MMTVMMTTTMMMMIIVFIYISMITEASSQDVITVEICEMKTFEASCSQQDEVMMIVEAQLGRMKKGKCMLEDFGYLNCSLDVKPELDAFCSGRKECEVKVDDTTFIRPTPCHTDLKNHLIVSYKCIKVLRPDIRCSIIDFTHPSSFHHSGFIASTTVERTGCGLTNSPLTLRAGEGQRINLTLHDVTYKLMVIMMMIRSSNNHQGVGSTPDRTILPDDFKNFGNHFVAPVGTCRVYATIRDSDKQDLLGRGSSICGHQSSIVNAFTSMSNLIEIRFMGTHKVKDSERKSSPLTIDDILKSPQFLFQYSVIGCLESELPKEAWKRRSPDGRSVVLGCPGSDVTWVMTCNNGWEGRQKECVQGGFFPMMSNVSKIYTTFVVGIIAIIVSCFVLVFGVICIRRNLKQRSNNRNMTCADEQYGLRSAGVKGEAKMHSASGHFITDDIYQDGNEYARMRLQMNQQNQHGSRDLLVRLVNTPGGPSETGYGDQNEHIYESADTLKLQMEMCSSIAMPSCPLPQLSTQEMKSSLHERMPYESNKNLVAKPLPFPKPKEIIQNQPIPIPYHLQTLDEIKQGNYSL